MRTVKRFSSLSEDEARWEFSLGEDARDWKVSLAQQDIRDHKLKQKSITSILYRPFDQRFTFYTGRTRGFICMPRTEVMSHMLAGSNIGLSTTRSVEIGRGWEHVFCTSDIIQLHTVSLKEVNYLFPLYLFPEIDLFNNSHGCLTNGRKPNLSHDFIEDLSSRLKMTFIVDGKGNLKKTFGPEDIFDYMYAVFHSPTYRSRYAEFLKIDFPRLPLTSNPALFRHLCSLGEELVALHLMEKHGSATARYAVAGDNLVEKVRYSEPGQGAKEGQVWINKTQYFEGVPPEVWEFHIGGYQVCEKWLKDRKSRQLSYDDITYYQQIVSALSETIHLMAEIDNVISSHGGWPIG
jgi:predicted helicase